MPLDFDKHNQDVKDWAKRMTSTMQYNGASLGIMHRENSQNPAPSMPQIKNSYKYDTGAIEVVGFRFPRSLIYTHKGAGKGRGGTSGSTWVDRYGNRKGTNPKSMGKMGTGGRVKKPWFTRSMDGSGGLEQLADLVADNLGATITTNILK